MREQVKRSVVEKLLKNGWKWSRSVPIPNPKDGSPTGRKIRMLGPPDGDERKYWCAMWLPYKKTGLVPHWGLEEAAKS